MLSAPRCGRRSLLHVDVGDLVDRAGLDAGDESARPVDLGVAQLYRRAPPSRPAPGSAAGPPRAAARPRPGPPGPTSRGSHHGTPGRSCGSTEAVAEAAKMVKKADQPDADHQRRRGRRRALRVAHGVLAGQAAGDAQPRRRGADDPADRAGDDRAEDGHAEEGDGRRRHRRRAGRCRPGRTGPGRAAARPPARTSSAGARCAPASRPSVSTATSRMAATGGTLEAPAGPGRTATSMVTPRPARNADDRRRPARRCRWRARRSRRAPSSAFSRWPGRRRRPGRADRGHHADHERPRRAPTPSTWRRLAPMARSRAISGSAGPR